MRLKKRTRFKPDPAILGGARPKPASGNSPGHLRGDIMGQACKPSPGRYALHPAEDLGALVRPTEGVRRMIPPEHTKDT